MRRNTVFPEMSDTDRATNTNTNTIPITYETRAMRESVPYKECAAGQWGKDCSKKCGFMTFCTTCSRLSGRCEEDLSGAKDVRLLASSHPVLGQQLSSSPVISTFFSPAAASPLFDGCTSSSEDFFFHCFDCSSSIAVDLPIMTFGHPSFSAPAADLPQPQAQRYYGRQFRDPENVLLGDGRSHTYFLPDGRVKNTKGTGKTSFSRPGGDGRASFKLLCLEYLALIALHGLRIVSTKPTALLLSSCEFDSVVREQYYDGNYELFGAGVLMREAPFPSSPFLRLGTVSSASDASLLAPVLFPDACGALLDAATLAKCFVENVVARNAATAARWQSAGFVHGSLNSDNIGLLGETIDCTMSSFISRYDLDYTPNFLDDGEARLYSFGAQVKTLTWRLESMALDASVTGFDVVGEFNRVYIPELHRLFDEKLGLSSALTAREGYYESAQQDYMSPAYGLLNWIEKSSANYHAAMYLIPEALSLSDGRDTPTGFVEESAEIAVFVSHLSRSCFADPAYDEMLRHWLASVYLPIACHMSADEKARALLNSRGKATPAFVFKPETINEVCHNVEFAGNDARGQFEEIVQVLASPFQHDAKGVNGSDFTNKLSVLLAAPKIVEVSEGDNFLIWSCGAQ